MGGPAGKKEEVRLRTEQSDKIMYSWLNIIEGFPGVWKICSLNDSFCKIWKIRCDIIVPNRS